MDLSFTITLSNPVDTALTVRFSTADGTATTADNDYTAQSDVTITIPANTTSMAHDVVVHGDTTVELDETLTGLIGGLTSGGRNVSLGAATATGTILNDDSATVAISGGAVVEGNSGTVDLPFTITLSNPVDTAVTVRFSTSDGTATTADNDYVAQSDVMITIPANTNVDGAQRRGQR